MATHHRVFGIGLAFILAIGTAACGGEESSGTTGSVTGSVPASTPSTTAPDTTTPPTQQEPAAQGRVIALSLAGGEVTGGGRITVPVDEEVTLRVTSDVPEEIHVHGYDKYLDLAPGATASVTFTADIPGIFEVELHGSGEKLADLVVR
jgi:heme/copper-type cytochrome/quinol oxidase subunit 2